MHYGNYQSGLLCFCQKTSVKKGEETRKNKKNIWIRGDGAERLFISRRPLCLKRCSKECDFRAWGADSGGSLVGFMYSLNPTNCEYFIELLVDRNYLISLQNRSNIHWKTAVSELSPIYGYIHIFLHTWTDLGLSMYSNRCD